MSNSQQSYKNLSEMLSQNKEAYSFFTSLPEYVQETISERANNIRTKSDLHTYAENLLSGDK